MEANEQGRREPDHVYILFMDIVGFTTIRNARLMEDLIIRFNEVVKRVVQDWFSELSPEGVKEPLMQPTGDGCLIVVPVENHTHTLTLDVLRLGITLHKALKKLPLYKDPIPKNRVMPLRMGIANGEATLITAFGRDVYVGLDISVCQRIMDFGGKWHILLSESFVDNLPRGTEGEDFTKDEFSQVDNWKGLGVIVKRCWYKYRDKQDIEHTIYKVHGGNSEQIGCKDDPPPRPSAVLDRSSVLQFDKLLSQCSRFFSITLITPEGWLTDMTLMHVLITQGRYHGSGLNGLKNNTREYERIFIWPKGESENKRAKILLDFNRAAGIVPRVLEKKDAERAVRIPDIKESGKAAIRRTGEGNINEFIKHPLRDMYICFDNNDEIMAAGYGKQRDDGTYTVESLPDRAFDFAKDVFDVLKAKHQSLNFSRRQLGKSSKNQPLLTVEVSNNDGG